MYLNHFGLAQSPFRITPNTEFFYKGGNRGAVLEALLYAIVNGEGIVKVTGEIGSGKTMICRTLESRLPASVEAIYLANPSLNRDDVFHVIGGELGLATEGKHASEILRLLQNYLIEKHATGKQVVLLVEEAQAMPLDTLEELRLLSNLETSHHKLLQIVLFGQPELDKNLALPNMRQLKERITHGFILHPLTRIEIRKYLNFRLRVAGYRGPDLFHPKAVRLIAAASQGITRRINVLADKALLAAFSKNTHHIKSKQIQAAIADSEFILPRRVWPVKNIVIALLLLALGGALGAGWQLRLQDTSPPPPSPTRPEAALANPAPPPTSSAPPPATPAAAPPPALTVTPEAAVAARSAEAEPPSPTPDPATGILPLRLAATRAWLAKEKESRHTIQLMILSHSVPAQLEKLLTKMDNDLPLEQIYIYPTRISTDNQFGVTFGDFSSRAEALAALDQLPGAYLANHPIVRTAKGIRGEMASQSSRTTAPEPTGAAAPPSPTAGDDESPAPPESARP